MDGEQLVIDGLSDLHRIDPVTGKKDEFVLDEDFSYAGYQITREEFFARVDSAEKGPSYAMLPNENLTDYLKRRGYDL